MRQAFSMLIVVGLVILAGFSAYRGSWVTALAFLSGAAVMLLPFVRGGNVGEYAHAENAMDFVRNPAGAIVEEAVGRLFGGNDDAPRRPAAPTAPAGPAPQESSFDADAAFARYMANRAASESPPNGPEAATQGVSRPQGFGRKGLG